MCVIALVREICKLALNVTLSNFEFCQLKDLKRPLFMVTCEESLQLNSNTRKLNFFLLCVLARSKSFLNWLGREKYLIAFCDIGSALEGSLNMKPVALAFKTMVSTCQHCEKLGTLGFLSNSVYCSSGTQWLAPNQSAVDLFS